MRPVTDPDILSQLEGGGPKPVTDPALLAQLEGGASPLPPRATSRPGATRSWEPPLATLSDLIGGYDPTTRTVRPGLPERAALSAANSLLFNLPGLAHEAATGQSFTPPAESRLGQAGEALGSLYGFVKGPVKAAEWGLGKVAPSLFKGASTVGREIIRRAGSGAATLGLASAATEQGGLAKGDWLGNLTARGKALASGAGMGAAFGGMNLVNIPKAPRLSQALRFGLAQVYRGAAQGEHPLDERDFVQKVFDAGLDAYFTRHGQNPKEIAALLAEYHATPAAQQVAPGLEEKARGWLEIRAEERAAMPGKVMSPKEEQSAFQAAGRQAKSKAGAAPVQQMTAAIAAPAPAPPPEEIASSIAPERPPISAPAQAKPPASIAPAPRPEAPKPLTLEPTGAGEPPAPAPETEQGTLASQLRQFPAPPQSVRPKVETRPEQQQTLGAAITKPDWEGVRARQQAKKGRIIEPQTYHQYVKQSGGLRETPSYKGELDEFKRFPGLVNKSGAHMDELAERSIKDGWLPEGSTESDALNLLKQDLRNKVEGKPRIRERPSTSEIRAQDEAEMRDKGGIKAGELAGRLKPGDKVRGALAGTEEDTYTYQGERGGKHVFKDKETVRLNPGQWVEEPVRAAKGEGGPEFGMGLGGAGEAAKKTAEDVKGAWQFLTTPVKPKELPAHLRPLPGQGKPVLTPEREANLRTLGEKLADIPERLRHSYFADALYQMKNRFKTPAAKSIVQDVDDIQVKSSVSYGRDMDKLAQAGKGLSREQRVEAGRVIQGRTSPSDPNLLPFVRAWQEVYGRGPGSTFERARKLNVQVTEADGKKRSLQFVPRYMPRQLTKEVKAQMGPDVAKFFDKVRVKAGVAWGESQRPGKGRDAWENASREVWEEWQKEKRELHPTTKQAVDAMMRSGFRSPWIAMQHLYAEIGYDIVGWHGSLERPRTAPPLPEEYYEQDPLVIATNDLWKRHQRIEQIERWGQDQGRLRARLDLVAKQNPNEYRDAKDLVALSTGKYEQAHRLPEGLKSIADDFLSFQYGLKIGLGTSTIENTFQAAISTALKHGAVPTAKGQAKALFHEASKRLVARTGINMRSMAEMMTGKELGKDPNERWMARVADRLTRANLFQGVNRLQNAGAVITTAEVAQKWADAYRKGSIVPGRRRMARMTLEELGIDPKEIPADGKLTDRQLEEAGYKFARDSQLQKNVLNEPKWANDPRARWLYVLKRFGMKQFNWFREEMVKETKKGNVMFPLRALAFGMAAGEMTIQAKHLLKEFVRYVVTLGEDPVEWWKERQPEWWQRGLEDVAAVATLGWFSNIFRPDKEGKLKTGKVVRNVSWNVTPVAASDIGRAVEFGQRVGEHPWSATKSLVKSQVPAVRLLEGDDDEKAPPALDWTRPRRRERRRRVEW